MTVESATYISDLNSSYPAGSDAKSEGDDHIRLIKAAVKATFPNVNGAVSATDEELNYVDVTTLGTMQASKALTADSGNIATVPSGGTLNIAGTFKIGGTTILPSAAELNYVDGVTSAIQTQLDAKLTSTPTFGIQFTLDVGADGDYTLDQYATFGYTINSAVYKTGGGTITANVKIDGTSVTGLSALSLTNSEGGPTNATAANAVSAGNTLSVTLSDSSSASKISLKLNCTRA